MLPALEGWLREQRPTVYLSTHAPMLADHERVAGMRALARVAAGYEHCLDRRLAPLDPRQLTTPGYTDRFSELVLTDMRPSVS